MKRLNLHTHTKYSDGLFSIRDLLQSALKTNHEKLVITDHCYYFSGKNNEGSFEAQHQEIDLINSELGKEYIIQGIEATTKCGDEEILIIGREACKTWLVNKSGKDAEERLNILTRIKHYHECAFVLCHPALCGEYGLLTKWDKFLVDELYQLCDAYEVINSGEHYIREQEWLRQIIPNRRELIGYDEHHIAAFKDEWPCNELPDDTLIETELDLINWIKSYEGYREGPFEQ